MSGMGSCKCPNCGASSRLKGNALVLVGSTLLGLVVAGGAILFRSWRVGALLFVPALLADALMDRRFRTLELVERPPS